MQILAAQGRQDAYFHKNNSNNMDYPLIEDSKQPQESNNFMVDSLTLWKSSSTIYDASVEHPSSLGDDTNGLCTSYKFLISNEVAPWK